MVQDASAIRPLPSAHDVAKALAQNFVRPDGIAPTENQNPYNIEMQSITFIPLRI
jgi:hypothetical protein